MIASGVADDLQLWQLFRAVVADGAAWPRLLAALEPELAKIARRQPIGRLRDREDSAREIVTRVFTRLHAREFAAIRKLCAMDPPPELRAYLRVIVRRSAIDFMREHPEFVRATPSRPNGWISLATLSSGAQAPGPNSIDRKRELVVSTIRDMVARVAAVRAARGDDGFGELAIEWKIARIHVRRLGSRGEQMMRVLGAVVEGHNQTEIAERLGLTRREVELTVRYLEELLHARFADAGP